MLYILLWKLVTMQYQQPSQNRLVGSMVHMKKTSEPIIHLHRMSWECLDIKTPGQ